jgi:membrane protease YdiL (CAAX protease family)
VVVILTSVRLLAPVLHNVETNPLEEMATGGLMNAAAFGVVGILAGGVREELQRAFMLRRFEYFGGDKVGVVVLSIAFGLGHVVQGWDAAVTTGALGLCVGGDVPVAAQQHCANREPRGLQLDRGITYRYRGVVNSVTSPRARRPFSHCARC